MKYPEDFINKVIQGDYLEVMKNIPPESIDLVITDPPYNINLQEYYYSNRKRKNYSSYVDTMIDFKKLAPELFRVLKNKSHCYIFCGYQTYAEIYEEFIKYFKMENYLIWDKGWGTWLAGNYGYRYKHQTEICIYFSKGRRKLSNPDLTNILRINRVIKKEKVEHPTQKPIELLSILIRQSSNENDLVLDCFMGSGSVAVACKNTKRNWLGIELNPEYVKIAEERIRSQTPPLL